MVKTGDFYLLVMSQWCFRLSCAFHVRGESSLALSNLDGPQQPFRRGRKRLSGRKTGRGGERKKRILQSIGRVVVLDECPEHQGHVAGEDLAWGGGGRGATILLLLRLLMLLRSIHRCQRRGQSAEHLRGCRRGKGRGKVGWCAGAKFSEHDVGP
jgi:hypothetical protein